jgi:hypothetical protein
VIPLGFIHRDKDRRTGLVARKEKRRRRKRYFPRKIGFIGASIENRFQRYCLNVLAVEKLALAGRPASKHIFSIFAAFYR